MGNSGRCDRLGVCKKLVKINSQEVDFLVDKMSKRCYYIVSIEVVKHSNFPDSKKGEVQIMCLSLFCCLFLNSGALGCVQ